MELYQHKRVIFRQEVTLMVVGYNSCFESQQLCLQVYQTAVTPGVSQFQTGSGYCRKCNGCVYESTRLQKDVN